MTQPIPRRTRMARRGVSLSITTAAAARAAAERQSQSPSPSASRKRGGRDKAVRHIIDVRTPVEFAEGHLEGAVNIDYTAENFSEVIADLNPDAHYIVYCRTGRRSAKACAEMAQAGLSNVSDAGGYQDAAESLKLPIVSS